MSTFSEKTNTYTPRFKGTMEEATVNVASHDFRKVYLKDKFSEVYDQDITANECSKCGILDRGGFSLWPCGALPDPISYRAWKLRGP